MKVLILCTDAYGGHGGIALYTRDLIEAIATHPRVERVVAVPRVMPHAPEPIPPRIEFLAAGASGRAAYVRALNQARKRGPYDLVVCAHINLLPVAMLLRRPTLLMLYGIEAWKPWRAAATRLLPRVDAAAAISSITLERFLSWADFNGRTFLIPNAIHLDAYAVRTRNPELVARWGLDGKRVLMTFGRMVAAERYKGFDEVLEVMPDLVRAHPDLVYFAAGSGSDLPRLRAKAAALGIERHVVFSGPIDEREKTDVYNLADVYVMPSRGEGFGFVLLEALACGVPVIASAYDGGREAVRGGELGLLVDPSNLADVRLAIEEVLANPRRSIPAGLEYFAFPNFESRVHSVIDDMLSRGDGERPQNTTVET